MHLFNKTCHCRLRDIPFRSAADFDAHAVKAVYCNLCSRRTSKADVAVEVRGVPGWSGNFLIDWNEGYLEQHDPAYRPTAAYARALLADGKVAFGFLPQRASPRTIRIVAWSNRPPPTRGSKTKKRISPSVSPLKRGNGK